jgi:phosphate transport system substrate-binding protein
MTWTHTFLGRVAWAAWILAGCLSAAAALPPAQPAVLRLNGSGACLELLEAILGPYRQAHPEVRIDLGRPLGSNGALKALLAGDLDLVAVARSPSPAETAQGAQALEYGRTPLALVTSRVAGPAGLTTDQLAAILAGEVKAWPDGQRVRVVLRPEHDTDTQLLKGLGPAVASALLAAHRRPGMMVGATDSDANEQVAGTEGALGTSARCATLVRQERLRPLALNGVEPTTEALAQGTYPLAKRILLVTTPATPAAGRDFLRFATSAQGRALAGKAGVLVQGSAQAGKP